MVLLIINVSLHIVLKSTKTMQDFHTYNTRTKSNIRKTPQVADGAIAFTTIRSLPVMIANEVDPVIQRE